MITDLRNPCMKAEHWRTLESVVGTALSGEELTVAALETLKVFSYGTKIQEVTHKYTFGNVEWCRNESSTRGMS